MGTPSSTQLGVSQMSEKFNLRMRHVRLMSPPALHCHTTMEGVRWLSSLISSRSAKLLPSQWPLPSLLSKRRPDVEGVRERIQQAHEIHF